MLPSRPEPKPSKVRVLLEQTASALFDDPDAEEQAPARPRRRDKETPRQRYVRDMETRWAEFHRAETQDGDGFIGLIIYWVVVIGVPLAITVAVAISRWIVHLPDATQWKVGGGLGLMYVAWILWQRTHPKPEER